MRKPTTPPAPAAETARGAPLAPPPSHVRRVDTRRPGVHVPGLSQVALNRALDGDFQAPTPAAAPAAGDGPCTGCSGEGRVFVTPKGLREYEPTPCPWCRPEASQITRDGRFKDADGRRAARAAQQRGL